MTRAHQLQELLERWRQLREQGQEMDAGQLCAGQSELAAELAAQIQAVQRGEDTGPPQMRTRPQDASECVLPPPPSLQVPATLAERMAMAARVHGIQADEGALRAENLAADPDLTLPTKGACGPAGRYEILSELGRGGMGVVFKARDRQSGRVVALKTMQSRGGLALEFFKREFRFLQGVSHANLVQLYALESDGNEWLLTMEFVEGVDFLTHVRPAPRPGDQARSALDVDRLRPALGQLAEGVAALHAHRRVHRDLKPQNVRVTPHGRVVVLDFGLAAELGPAGEHAHTDQALMGTLSYLAPEQCCERPISSPASDWYSVGVMVYQAMTGHLPFTGTALQLIEAKQHRDPPAPCDLDPDVPADLDDLCMALLRRQPQDRPAAVEVLDRLARLPGGPPRAAATSDEAPLLGRGQHLHFLEEAFADLQQRRAVLVTVHGPSGVGKTALVRHFLEGVRGHGAVVLAGRCYERESVPYKALDPLVDELGRYLRGLRHDEVAERLPRDVGPLTRVFAVLGCVTAVAEAAARSTPAPDPHEVRRRAGAALRELLARVGDRQPLVLHIDDLQWGDVDSAHLLADLLRPPDPPSLLLLASYRSEDAASPCLSALSEALGRAGTIDRRDLSVAPLTEDQTCELVRALLGNEVGGNVAGIARDSGGNPFFITQLVQELRSDAGRGAGLCDGPAQGDVTLDGIIRARAERLPDGAQRLLKVIAVSGRPLGETVAFQAACAGAEARSLLAILESARFIRGTGSAGELQLETYHDRIREAVVAGVDAAHQVDCHRALAIALEAAGDADPEFLAGHWEAGRNPERAGRFYSQAAARAAAALAFDRAARLYRAALELLPKQEAQAGGLRASLGDALTNAGRGAEAAREYLAAAEGARTARALELQQRAVQQFLVSGHVDDGFRVLDVVLASVGVKLPRTPRRALFSLLSARIQLWFRGIGFQERDASQVALEDLRRIDIFWSMATGLGLIDIIRGADFQTRGLLHALRAGEPLRIARALGLEAGHVATLGSASSLRTAKLLKAQETLAHRVGTPYAVGLTSFNGGVAAFLQGRWRDSLRLCAQSERIFRDSCTGVAWELDSVQLFGLSALWRLGELAELSRRLPFLLQEARARGDLFALVSLGAVISPMARMAADDPDRARSDLDEVLGQWSHQGFHLQHAYGLYRQGELDLYQGRAEAACRRATNLWAALRGALMLRIQELRIIARNLRAGSALAAAAAAPSLKSRLGAIERDARRLERERRPDSSALARLARAGVAAVRGDALRAVSLLREAAAGFEAADMSLYAAAARRRLGGLLGGEQGRALVAQADAWMAGQQVCNPQRMTAMLAPGFAANG